MVKKLMEPKKKILVKEKIASVKKKVTRVVYRDPIHVERAIMENFVAFQKVMTNLSLRFDNLSSQISKLLELFEASAKNLAKKDFNVEKESQDSKEILSKLNTLTGQNKIIARGLTLIHESDSRGIKKPIQREFAPASKSYQSEQEKTPPRNIKQEKFYPGDSVNPPSSENKEEYEKSLSFQDENDLSKP